MAETTLDNLPDETLARQVQGGCVASFEALDRRFRGRLVYILQKRGHARCEADAEDAAQQALLTAYLQMHQYDPGRRFSTWLFTIALRKGIDQQRQNARRPSHGGDATLPLVASGADDPPTALASAEAADNLWALAQRVLDDRPWSVLWLHYGEAQSPGDIGKMLGLSSVNVRVILHRARQTLGRALREADAKQSADRAAPRPTARGVWAVCPPVDKAIAPAP